MNFFKRLMLPKYDFSKVRSELSRSRFNKFRYSTNDYVYRSKRGASETVYGMRYRPAHISPRLKEVPRFTPIHAWVSRGYDAGAYPLNFFIALIFISLGSEYLVDWTVANDRSGIAETIWSIWSGILYTVAYWFYAISFYPLMLSMAFFEWLFNETFLFNLFAEFKGFVRTYEILAAGEYEKAQLAPGPMVWTVYGFAEAWVLALAMLFRGHYRFKIHDFRDDPKLSSEDAQGFAREGERYFKFRGNPVKRFVNKYIFFH